MTYFLFGNYKKKKKKKRNKKEKYNYQENVVVEITVISLNVRNQFLKFKNFCFFFLKSAPNLFVYLYFYRTFFFVHCY